MKSPFPPQMTRAREGPGKPPAPWPALLGVSHLRWDFMHQRPQHLLNDAPARQAGGMECLTG